MTSYPILAYIQSFVNFQNMDPEIKMFNSIFYKCYFCLNSEVKVVKRKNEVIFMHIKFQRMAQEIQIERAKRDYTFIHTYLLTNIHTDQPSHRISIS